MVLTAIAMSTQRLRVGHAGVLAPFNINSPLRVAERAATLDILSGGRFELGLAKSGGKEWETFGVDPDKARNEVAEAMRMIPRMWTEDPFEWNGKRLTVPSRSILPKPIQKPHPPLWMAGTQPDSFEIAARKGLGVLSMATGEPAAADSSIASITSST